MPRVKRVLRSGLLLIGIGFMSLAYAEVPIVDITQDETAVENKPTAASAPATAASVADPIADKANLPVEQRLTILERQMANVTQMNLLSQVNNLQQQIQVLRGQMEEQAHALQQMQDQVRSQYQDFDQRLSQQGSAKPGQLSATPTATKSTTVSSAENEGSASKSVAVIPSTSTNSSPDAALKEQGTYQTAYNYVKSKDYARAIPALQNFIKQYPTSSFTLNAHYWLGEVYLQKNQTDAAITEFNTIVSNYPNNPKVADAKLKLGFAYYNKKQWQQARELLVQVQKEFPGTPAAQLAKARLDFMKQQGK